MRILAADPSREHAPWSLYDYGFRAVIAPSFADIFYNNSLKNGLLPIPLSDERVTELADRSLQSSYQISIDLEKQSVTDSEDTVSFFEIDPFRKHCLLNGLDDIGLTLQHEAKIAAYESRRSAAPPFSEYFIEHRPAKSEIHLEFAFSRLPSYH